MSDRYLETPLSESSVSLKLEEIQKRCRQYMEDPEGMLELALDEPAAALRAGDPYNRQS